jgi:hypothetical protein
VDVGVLHSDGTNQSKHWCVLLCTSLATHLPLPQYQETLISPLRISKKIPLTVHVSNHNDIYYCSLEYNEKKTSIIFDMWNRCYLRSTILLHQHHINPIYLYNNNSLQVIYVNSFDILIGQINTQSAHATSATNVTLALIQYIRDPIGIFTSKPLSFI